MPSDPGNAFDFTSLRALHDPYPVYRELRRREPLHRAEVLDAWLVSRYDDVVRVLRDPTLFSSTPASFENTLLGANPPGHTRVRKIVARALPHATALEARIRAMMHELTQPIVRRGGCEFMGEVAGPLPLWLIAEILGIPRERSEDLKRWSGALVAGTEGPGGDDVTDRLAELDGFLSNHLDRCRRIRGDDILSTLLHAPDGLSLEDTTIVAKLLLVAGNETTTNLLGNTLLALLRHPWLGDDLRAHPERIPAFVEEVLRFDSPVQATQRVTTQPVEFAGGTMPTGGRVIALIGSANRDDHQFADPDRFLIDRTPQGHIAFGFGPHQCLGAQLSRLEARIVLETMLAELPRPSTARPLETLEFGGKLHIRGLTRLDLTFSE